MLSQGFGFSRHKTRSSKPTLSPTMEWPWKRCVASPHVAHPSTGGWSAHNPPRTDHMRSARDDRLEPTAQRYQRWSSSVDLRPEFSMKLCLSHRARGCNCVHDCVFQRIVWIRKKLGAAAFQLERVPLGLCSLPHPIDGKQRVVRKLAVRAQLNHPSLLR